MLLDLTFNKGRTVAEHYRFWKSAGYDLVPDPPAATAKAVRNLFKREKAGRVGSIGEIF
jgi:hypothetical protein